MQRDMTDKSNWTSTWTRRLVPIRRVIVVLAAIAMLLVPLVQTAAADDGKRDQGPRVHPQLLKQAATHPNDSYRVIDTRAKGDKSADSFVSGKGYKKIKDVASNGFVVIVKGKDIADLGKQAGVRHVSIDAPVRSTSTVETPPALDANLGTLYPPSSGVTAAWAAGFTGAGVGVAVLDTGIQSARP